MPFETEARKQSQLGFNFLILEFSLLRNPSFNGAPTKISKN